MSTEGFHDDEEDNEEEDLPDLHLPPDATMEDFFIAEDIWFQENESPDAEDLISYFHEEIMDIFGNEMHLEFMELQSNSEKARNTKVIDFFGDDVASLPIAFDLSKDQWDARKRAAIPAPPPPSPASVPEINTILLQKGISVLHDIFPEVKPDTEPQAYPPLETILERHKRGREMIVAPIIDARAAGVPDVHVRRLGFDMCMWIMNGKIKNYGVCARFLENMKFATKKQAAEIARLED